MSNELIHVAQIPVIEQRLRSIKPEIERRVSEAKSLACTPDTVISVKKTRSDLHKQFEEFEEQRKAVKALILEPLTAFEDIYKECVSDLFESADADLKTKIDDTESAIKSACEDGLREYFSELATAEHVEWLTYERAGIVVDMTSAKQKTPKKLREQITSFVTGVARGVEAISNMENANEIMVEFRRCLDVAEAIRVVQDRHQRIDTERRTAEARKAAMAAQRAAVQKVEESAPPAPVLAPPVVSPITVQEDEKVYQCSFTVRATKPQLKRLKEFMNQEGIKYE